MEAFRIRPITEADIRAVVQDCGGAVAHADADRRAERGSDFVVGKAAIELKLLDEDGFAKTERQTKLARLFRDEGFRAPVVVLDRENLSQAGRRAYDRIIEGPVKTAVASARQQLKQTRAERADTEASVLWVINNGYTAVGHDELVERVAHRVRNDTSGIDGIIVGGCYYHSDGFDSYFMWPLVYVAVTLQAAPVFDLLLGAWHRFTEKFMHPSAMFEAGRGAVKGPVIDTQFDVDGITYVKPAPPLGGSSEFYLRGRPRKDSTGLKGCPPVALTFPGLTRAEWGRFRASEGSSGLLDNYADWLLREQDARADGLSLKPFLAVPITFADFRAWDGKIPATRAAIARFANHTFQQRVQAVLANARETGEGGLLPSRYILAVTDEIGQDRANDLSHIAKVRLPLQGERELEPLVEDVRIFHEHAVALAAAYAIREGFAAVLWIRSTRYAWS